MRRPVPKLSPASAKIQRRAQLPCVARVRWCASHKVHYATWRHQIGRQAKALMQLS